VSSLLHVRKIFFTKAIFFNFYTVGSKKISSGRVKNIQVGSLFTEHQKYAWVGSVGSWAFSRLKSKILG